MSEQGPAPLTLPSYVAAWQAWAESEVEKAAVLKPHIRRFPLEQFDGCTLAPEVCRYCCLLHDIGYWYAETVAERKKADLELRRCIADIASREDRIWRWLWRVNALAFYYAVRICGKSIVSRRRAAWESAR